MSKKLFIPLFVLVFSISAFAQGRGGGGGRGGGAAGGGSPQQGNRPSSPGKPDSLPSANADSKAGAAKANAVDPTNTHGFKNYGQYVAANHVSEHMGIPLADLKSSMNAEGGSLGKAIHRLRPALSSNEVDAAVKSAEAASRKAQDEAKKAEAEAKKKAKS